MTLKTITDSSFEGDVLNNEGVVLVDFWATWCGPCRQIAPALKAISEEMDGQLVVAKVDIDENPTTPMKFGVRGVPTMVLFKGGKEISRKVGADAKGGIETWIKQSLSA